MAITKKSVIIAVMLAAIIFAGCDMQDHFIYFPDPVRPSAEALASEGLMFWMASGDDYRGLIGVAPGRAPGGTVIVFHGNAGKAVDR